METFVVFENSYIYMRNKFSHKFIKGGTNIMHNKKYLISVAMPGGGGRGWEPSICIIPTDTVTLT